MKIIKNILCASLASVLLTGSCLADTLQRDLTVYPDKVIKTTTKDMYGINYEWGLPESTGLLIENTCEVNPKAAEGLKGMDFPLNRMAGSSGQQYLWKEHVGPIESRSVTLGTNTVIGPLDWINSVRAIDSEAKFIYTVNMRSDSFENLADLVEYFSGDGSVNISGGVNWAQERIAAGYEKPIDIIWEIGNENDYSLPNVTVDEYIEYSKKYIDIIRRVDPDAKIMCFASTQINASIDDTKLNWHRQVLSKLGNDIDYIAYHSYYGLGNATRPINGLEYIERDIVDITGSDRIKIMITEHGPWITINGSGTPSAEAPRILASISGAANFAEYVIRMMRRPLVAGATQHALGLYPWAIIHNNGEVIYPSVVGDVNQLLIDYTVGESLDFELTGYDTTKNASAVLVCGATKTDDGINIVFSNRSEDDYNININLDGYYLSESRVIAGNEPYANKVDNPDAVPVVNNQYQSKEQVKSYTVPKLSVVGLKLKKQ